MFAVCTGSVFDPGGVRFWKLDDGRTFLTDSVTFAAVIAEGSTTGECCWSVCVLPDHLPLTCPSEHPMAAFVG